MSLAEHVRHTESAPRLHRDPVPATNFALTRGCALKRLRPERCEESIARQLIENEAQASQKVTSRHLLKLLRSDVRAEVPYLVFEWTGGRTLEDELRVEE